MVASVDGLACPLPLPRAHSRLDTGGGGGCPAWLRLVPSGENGWWCVAGTLPPGLEACEDSNQ
jgi:hypothetical protein